MSNTIDVKIYDDNGDYEVHTFPAKYEVCGRCHGEGTHLIPSIGEYAYSMEEFFEAFSDEEDRDEYFRRGGKYDVTCLTCKGQRVILVIDDEQCSGDQKEVLEVYYEQEREDAYYDRMCAEERYYERSYY
jgi:hypothetical protein